MVYSIVKQAKEQAAKNGRRDPDYEFGTNPCSEIILRPYQFCNLTEVVVRATDTIEDLEAKGPYGNNSGNYPVDLHKVPILAKGVVYKYRRRTTAWCVTHRDNGQPLDDTKNKGLEKTLEHLRGIAVSTNAEWADRLGIPVAAAITCVKPSGTVSQLVDSASGIHARHSPYYIRTVRGDNKDPLTQFMKDQGIPNEPCVMKGDTTTVFSFPS